MADDAKAKVEGEIKVGEVVIPEPVVEAPKETMTADEMKAAGFTADEVRMAEEQGLITKPVAVPAKTEAEIKKEADAKAKKEADDKKLSSPPKKDEDLTPEEEHERLTTFNANEKALYFKQKKERRRRQEIQSERDLLKIKNEQLAKELEVFKKKESDDLGEGGDNDPDKIITVAELEKRERAKKEEQALELEKEKNAKTKLNDLYSEARTRYADFDSTLALAKTVLDTQFEKSAEVRFLHNEFIEALATDREGDETAADIAYKIGKLHPDYKAGMPDNSADKGEEKARAEAKAKLEKILANQDKSKSSAAIGGSGGGNRIVSEDDLTPADVATLSQAAFDKLSPKTQERILRESCRK